MAGWPDVRISARQGFFDGILDGILAARGMLWLDALTGCWAGATKSSIFDGILPLALSLSLSYTPTHTHGHTHTHTHTHGVGWGGVGVGVGGAPTLTD